LAGVQDQDGDAAVHAEQSGNHHGAGQIRFNIANNYMDAAEQESTPARRNDLLKRALAYARAALRDFQHYQGRAAAEEAKAQQLIDDITRAM
jgi:hypothetical protein